MVRGNDSTVNGGYADLTLEVMRYLLDLSPCPFPDRFAALRHALLLAGRLFEETLLGTANDPLAGEPVSTSRDTLTHLSLLEFASGQSVRAGHEPDAHTVERFLPEERAALLRGAVRSQTPIEARLLLSQLGVSDVVDSLVRDALAFCARDRSPAELTAPLRRAFDEAERRNQPRTLVALLDVAATLYIPMLEAPQVKRLIRRWENDERTSLALLRYAGMLRLGSLLGTLQALLDRAPELSLARCLTLINALDQIGDPTSRPALEHLADRLAEEQTEVPLRALRQYLAAVLASERDPGPSPSRDGMVVAQFMFMGRIGRPGKGNSGGLGVFLSALGDALAERPGIAHVYTFVLLNATQALDDPPLLIQHTPGHTIVHVPVCCGHEITQREMMAQEAVVRVALEHILAVTHIQPNVFHIRYSDHGSRVAAQIAQSLGAKLIFTITTDPHRTLAAAADGGQTEDLSFKLHRVYVADQLLEMADGLVAMPRSAGIAPLAAYFPQFILDPQVQAKPLCTIGEGIRIGERDAEPTAARGTSLAALCHSETCREGYRLDPEFRDRPIMLNVGRLHPIKQQSLLVQAWAESGLWRDYNLVLIGGDLDNPSPTEQDMHREIESTFDRYPDARGRFCFLPAMPNAGVRRLERAIVQTLVFPLPHVYVCSSVKEEFGISVLEAMDAGFLAFGPKEGGLPTYIEPGTNGFLIDTRTAASIAQALTGVLGDGTFTVPQLRTIAAAGARTVQERSDIRKTATELAQFYLQIVGQGDGGAQ